MKKYIPLFCFLLILLIPFSSGSAASFEITGYDMEMRIEPDGAAYVVETVNYAFSGSYNGVTATIRHEGGVGFSDLRVLVDDQVLLQVEEIPEDDSLRVPYTYAASTPEDASQTEVLVYAPGQDGARVLRLEYRMSNFARRYQDAARINQIILRAETGYRDATFRLALSGSSVDEISAFVHGALGREDIQIQGDTIFFGPQSLRRGDWVEIMVLFPEGWLPRASMIAADIREDALAIEADLEEALRTKAETDARNARLLRYGGIAAVLLYAAGFVFLLMKQVRKYGLPSRVAPTTDDVLLSQVPVAIAQVLRDNRVSAGGLSAALMELSGEGVVTMESEEGDTGFVLKRPPAGLWSHQVKLVEWLFPGGVGETFWVSELDKGEDYEAARQFGLRYGQWKGQVETDAIRASWVFGNKTAKGLMAGLAAALGIGLGIALLAMEMPLLAAPVFLLAIAFAIGFMRLRRLTDAGEERLAALEGFVQNYEDILARSPGMVFGHAPLAMALGFMEPLANWIDQHPEYDYRDGDPRWGIPPAWIYGGWHHHMVRMERTVREAQHHNAKVSGPDDFGDGGSAGGGFSGSSGGSGGGSSHGAW